MPKRSFLGLSLKGFQSFLPFQLLKLYRIHCLQLKLSVYFRKQSGLSLVEELVVRGGETEKYNLIPPLGQI